MKFADYCNRKMRRRFFDSAWRTMADLIPTFVVSHFRPFCSFEEITVANVVLAREGDLNLTSASLLKGLGNSPRNNN
jgi:hypothetical protein